MQCSGGGGLGVRGRGGIGSCTGVKGEYGWGGLKGRGSSCEGELWGPEGGGAGLLGGFIRMAIGAPLGVRIEWGWVSLPSLRLPLHHFTPQLTHSPLSPRVPEMFKL